MRTPSRRFSVGLLVGLVAFRLPSCGGAVTREGGGSVSGNPALPAAQDATAENNASSDADAVAVAVDASCPACVDAAKTREGEAIRDAEAEGSIDRRVVPATDAAAADAAVVDASIFQRCVTYCESLPNADASTCNRICAGPPPP